MNLPITTIFAAIFVLALIPLTIQVGLKRLAIRMFFGDGGDLALAQRRAAQSNYLEHVPIFLVALAICEITGAPALLLWSAGGCMLVARTVHAYCMLFTNGIGDSRAVGMMLTFAAHLALGGFLVARALG
ncbi:MAPEG family protein [Parasphingorhabdus sp.]|uniref:MAPEG family protein n=1 Tax=Parasphingorhabdus sp. TaxID=2709688 RepID=UPI003A94D8B7